MKSKTFKRCIAIMLCMVIVLSGSGYLLAESLQEGTTAGTETEAQSEEGTTVEEKDSADEGTVEVDVPEDEEEQTQENAEGSTPSESEDQATESTKEETPAEETEPILQLTYEDDKVKITVDAVEAGNIPNGASLSVTPIEKKEVTASMSADEKAKVEEINEQYDLTEQKLQEKAENETYDIAGFLAYDITFVDADGNKLEPNGDVKVSMKYKQAEIPEEAKKVLTENDDQSLDVTVMHLEEDEKGEVKDVVDMVADENETATVETTSAMKVKKAEFVTDSFSVFTLTWQGSNSLKIQVVDEDGKSIGSDMTSNVAQATSVTTLADKVEVDGYAFKKATLGNVNGTEIKRLRRQQNGWWSEWQYSTSSNGRDDWWGVGNNEIYFVYTKVEPLTTANTIDHTNDGIIMKMTNYDSAANGLSNDIGGGYGNGNIKQGLLKSILTNGYPVTTKNGTSLADLFKNGTPVTNLFMQDIYNKTGYYEYSSFENYAYLSDETNATGARKFKVYDQIGTPVSSDSYFYRRGNFMPYNEILPGRFSDYTNDYDENGKDLPNSNPRKGERLYLSNGTDYYFGMYLQATFTQQKNGMVTHNGTKNPMRYEFNGDDDLWVYIDDVLVLDIGGIHDAHSGYIDFSTGEVGWYDCVKGGTPKLYTTTIKAMFQQASQYSDDLFQGNTFKDYTTHTLKMFYMERGAGASNLHVKFNLPVIPSNSVNVTKIVEDESGSKVDYAEDIDFKFKMYVEGEEYANQTYTIVENGQATDKTGKTDENGCFTLKHNQTARFSGIAENKKYRVQELGAFLNGYKVNVNGTTVWTPNEEGVGEATPTADSGELAVATRPTVTFTNIVKNTVTLSIAKQLANGVPDEKNEFQMQLKLGGQIYNGYYTIDDNQYSCVSGIIKIKAGQTATISGLPYGIAFEVQEVLDGRYLPTYEISGDAVGQLLPDDENDILSVSAQMSGNCQVTVTNAIDENAKTTVSVNKEWSGDTEATRPQSIEVQLYQNGVPYVAPVEITSADNWKYEFSGLPYFTKGEDGKYIKNVYTVKETKVGSDEVVAGVGGDYQSSERINEDGSITIVNVKQWQIIKISESSKEYTLEGAVFKLETEGQVYYGKSQTGGVINWYINDNCTEPLDGTFPDGTYILSETKAPSGYMVSSENWTISMENGCVKSVDSSTDGKLSVEKKDGKDTFYFKNKPLYDLPSTGGIGIFWYTIGGMLLMMAAALILYKRKCREVLDK